MRLTYGRRIGRGGHGPGRLSEPRRALRPLPEGVAVDSQGTVLATLPYPPAGSSTAITSRRIQPVLRPGSTPAADRPDARSGERSPTSTAAGSPWIRRTTSSWPVEAASLVLRRWSGDRGTSTRHSRPSSPTRRAPRRHRGDPTGIAYQDRRGDELSGVHRREHFWIGHVHGRGGAVAVQRSGHPAQLRNAYGIDQISFTGPGGTTVAGDGTGRRRSPSSRRGSTRPRCRPDRRSTSTSDPGSAQLPGRGPGTE